MSLITPAEAEALILAQLPTLSSEEVALEQAPGRILAEPLRADRPLPPYDRVMMDGIAFRSADLDEHGPTLTVHGLHPAGAPEPSPLPPGHCWEIMTGACLPPDCDTVIPYEDTSREEERIAFDTNAAQPGRFVHLKGSDFSAGSLLVPAHRKLRAREISVAATVGASTVRVLRRPRVSILTTGDELVRVDDDPAPHQVRRSNGPALRSALAQLGTELSVSEHVPDDEDATANAVRRALDRSDLVLLCGGISKGRLDFVRPAVERLLGPPTFHGVAQRPGKPLAFWDGPPAVAALPGNPMSVLVCFHRYLRPFLEHAQCQRFPVSRVALAAPFPFPPPLAYFLPVALDHTTATRRAQPLPLANSGDFASALETDGFVELPPDREEFPEGFEVSFVPWL